MVILGQSTYADLSSECKEYISEPPGVFSGCQGDPRGFSMVIPRQITYANLSLECKK
jgi:hypothetical protein